MDLKRKVCHITSMHPRNDSRIFHKECISLSKSGYFVNYIVADGLGDETKENIRIIDTGKPKNRFYRSQCHVWKILKVAISLKAELYHFHDPELVPIAIILKVLGREVVYDVHEDNFSSAKQKTYLPSLIRILASLYMLFLDYVGRIFFHIIIAERYYKKRFPQNTPVLNYPKLFTLSIPSRKFGVKNLLYTGNITIDRGALILADLVNYDPEISITMVGRCSRAVFEKIIFLSGENRDRIYIEGLERHVDFERILEYYSQDKWMAGVAIFPFSEHYHQKELTKFFEYMESGLPIIASNFKNWSDLILNNDVGIVVDPSKTSQIIKKINTFFEDKKKLQQVSERGKQLFMNKYNWNTQEQNLIELYKRII